MSTAHEPVMVDEIIALLCADRAAPQRVIDGTLGAGGHTQALIEAGAGHVLGLDVDTMALAIARENLQAVADRVTIIHDSYTNMDAAADSLGWAQVDAILVDLGVSSMQLDIAERGFAFMQDGPLDMRFDPSGVGATAADIVNTWDPDELADIFRRYGEEQHSRRIAQAIATHRPFQRTTELAAVIADALPDKRPHGKPVKRIHPATRVFQALRIVVNDELGAVERLLPVAINRLRPGGRLAVISFHSLEDRIVKHYFREASTEVQSPPGMMLDEKEAVVRLITRKPVVAADDEIARNPRSRSAKLRVVEKL